MSKYFRLNNRPSFTNLEFDEYRALLGYTFVDYVSSGYYSHQRAADMMRADYREYRIFQELIRPAGERTSHIHKASRGMTVQEWAAAFYPNDVGCSHSNIIHTHHGAYCGSCGETLA